MTSMSADVPLPSNVAPDAPETPTPNAAADTPPPNAAADAPDAPSPNAAADTPETPMPKETAPGMDHRRERIRVETERHRIVGELTLARDGYRSRVSDVLNAPERDFITLTDATVQPLDDGPAELHPFVTVARRHIVFAVAADEVV